MLNLWTYSVSHELFIWTTLNFLFRSFGTLAPKQKYNHGNILTTIIRRVLFGKLN